MQFRHHTLDNGLEIVAEVAPSAYSSAYAFFVRTGARDETEEISPGDVMIIDENDRLRKCISAYDKRVAGVLSGAGEYKPAIVLDRKIGPHRRVPVALVGKTYC